MPHFGVATLTGVAPNGIGQGGYLLKGFEHLLAYGTVAPSAAGRTFVPRSSSLIPQQGQIMELILDNV